jgi:hypothetical protein
MATKDVTVATVDEVVVPEVIKSDTDIITVVVHPVDPLMDKSVYANLKEYKLEWGKATKLPCWVVNYMDTIGESVRDGSGSVVSFTHKYNIVRI